MKEPKKIGIGYKLLEMNGEGKLFPLFIDKGKEIPMEKWLPAENKPTKNFAARPGWHVTMSTPDAPWLRGYDGSDLGAYKSRFSKGKRVWCEVLFDMTNDYCEEARNMPKKCFTDRIPENGFYFFNEANRGTWVITSAIKITRVLTDEEVDAILTTQNYNKVEAYKPYKASFEKRMKNRKEIA